LGRAAAEHRRRVEQIERSASLVRQLGRAAAEHRRRVEQIERSASRSVDLQRALSVSEATKRRFMRFQANQYAKAYFAKQTKITMTGIMNRLRSLEDQIVRGFKHG